MQISLYSQPMWALKINLLLNQLIVLGPQTTRQHQLHQLLNGKSALRSNQEMCLSHQVIRRASSITIQAASSKVIQLTLLLKIRHLLQIKQQIRRQIRQQMEHPLLTKQVMRHQMVQLQLIPLLMLPQLQIKQPIQPQIKQIIILLFHQIKHQI